MKGLLVVLVVLAALFFLPTPALADHQPVCPLLMSEPGERLASAAVQCGIALQPAAESSGGIGDASRAGNAADRSIPSTGTGRAPRYSHAGEMARSPAAVEAAAKAKADAAPQEKYHTVQIGENLSKIAQAYDTSLEVLLLANPHIVNPHLIHADDALRIPSPEETERLRSEAEKRRIAIQRQIVEGVPHQGERWVDVDLQTQTVRAYAGDTLMGTFIASTGTANHPTVTGQFRVWLKLAADDMKGPGYYLKDVPHVMYFYKDYALHGTYWHNNFGTPMSHGCVNLRPEDAAWLFDFGAEGMLVNVH